MTKRPLVLLIEDDTWFAEQQARVLEAAGFQVEHAPHALAAMDVIDAHRPDVLLCDVFLAGPNIFTLLHELRSHGDLASIPIVLCTNSADQLADEDVTAYGVSSVLDKTTMTPDDIVAAVKRVLL
jgi:CheY-like chemotaxis protein